MSVVERFFWSNTAEIVSQIQEWSALKLQADTLIRSLLSDLKVPGIGCRLDSNGRVSSFTFKDGSEMPEGWSDRKRPYANSKAGRELKKRLAPIRMPQSNDLLPAAFKPYDWLVHEGCLYTPTVIVVAAIHPSEISDIRLILRQPLTTFEPFTVPDGWNEWKEWEMLKFIDEFNTRRRARSA